MSDEHLAVVRDLASSGRSVYLGRGENSEPAFCSVRDSVTVVGPTGSGKTSGVIAPSVALHPGPAVVTSVRGETRDPDIRQATMPARQRIAAALGGEVVELALDDSFGFLAPTVWWEIASGCGEWNVASFRAKVLADAGVAERTDNAEHFRLEVATLLAPLLFAAHLFEPELRGEDIFAALQNGRAGGPEAVGLTIDAIFDQLRAHYPGHTSVRQLAPYVASSDVEWRNGTLTMAQMALAVLGQERVGSPRALDLDAFVRSYGTIYITAGKHAAGQARAMIAGLIETLEQAWNRAPAAAKGPSLLLALDEVAVIAPVASLPQGVGMYGGSGIQLLLGFVRSSDASVWGDALGDGVVNGTNHLVLFPGLDDQKLTSKFASLAPQAARYHAEAALAPGVVQARGLADGHRLVRERTKLEEALLSVPETRRAGMELRVAAELQAERLRVLIENRYGPSPEAIIRELRECTTYGPKPQYRTTLSEAELFAGKDGKVFVRSGPDLRFVTLTKYYDDPWLRSLMGTQQSSSATAWRRQSGGKESR